MIKSKPKLIDCCECQIVVQDGKSKEGEDRYICLYCGQVLTESMNEESPIIICGERTLINLRRENGLEELANRLEERCKNPMGGIMNEQQLDDPDIILVDNANWDKSEYKVKNCENVYDNIDQECHKTSYLPNELIVFNPSNPKDIDNLIGKFGPEGVMEIARVLKEDAEYDMSISGDLFDVCPLYAFHVENGDKVYYVEMDWVESHYQNLNMPSEMAGKELMMLKNISYEDVQMLHRKHLIYSIVESFERSDDVPQWYDRETAKYSWHKITN